ncbi:MAG: mannose-1-phosphate guanylyltransferase [Bacteroidota bacterium]
MEHKNHYVIIMAGGVGTRFWPMSRKTFPKQFHDILGTGRTLIQETFDRFHSFIPAENIYVVTNDRYFDLVKEQLPKLSDNQVLLEPMGRDTAPCVAYACFKINKINPNASFVVSPADHLIEKRDVFEHNIKLGLSAVESQDIIMTLGITPTRPDTGYGYIQYIEDETDNGYYKVKTFTEKPNLEVAKSFIESGDFLWNGGIFLFSGKTILGAFHENLPETAELFAGISSDYYTDGEQAAVNQAYSTCKPISIDYGIMEKAPNVFTIPSDFGWSDLGTWGSVYENSEHDDLGNALQGNHILHYKSSGNIVQVKDPNKVVVLDGLENFIVIDTGDALLVCKKDDEQFIKKIVGDLKSRYEEQFI